MMDGLFKLIYKHYGIITDKTIYMADKFAEPIFGARPYPQSNQFRMGKKHVL